VTPFGRGLPFSNPIKKGLTFPPIAGLTLRLESDLGVTTSGSDVTHWIDQVQSFDFETAGGGITVPTLVANQVHGHPAVRFNGVANALFSSALVSDVLTGAHPDTFKVIAVLKNNSAVSHASTSYDAPAVLADAASFWSPTSGDSTRINAGFYAGPDALASVVQATGALVYVEATLTAAAGGTLSLQVGTGGTPDTHTGAGTLGGISGFLKLGVNYANAVFWQGDLFAIYVATSMSGGEVDDLRTYINAKWGPGL